PQYWLGAPRRYDRRFKAALITSKKLVRACTVYRSLASIIGDWIEAGHRFLALPLSALLVRSGKLLLSALSSLSTSKKFSPWQLERVQVREARRTDENFWVFGVGGMKL